MSFVVKCSYRLYDKVILRGSAESIQMRAHCRWEPSTILIVCYASLILMQLHTGFRCTCFCNA